MTDRVSHRRSVRRTGTSRRSDDAPPKRPLSYSPYAYEIHEDPYPIYARLRAEAPVYRNDELDFWALSRHEDVLAAFRNVDGFSNAYGVSLEPSAFGPDAHKFMSFLALDPPRHTRMRSLVGKGFTPTKVAADGSEHPGHRARAPRAGTRAGIVRLHRRLRRQAADGRDLGAGRGAPGRTGWRSAGSPTWSCTGRTGCSTCRRQDMEAAMTLVGYYQDMVDERRTLASATT